MRGGMLVETGDPAGRRNAPALQRGTRDTAAISQSIIV
jgi:hypothetical protein